MVPWTTYVWIFVFGMCVASAHAGVVKRSVSSPTTQRGWAYVPSDASLSDSWIPIPSKIFDERNDTGWRQHFRMIYIPSKKNETLEPALGDNPLLSSFIAYLCMVGVFLLLVIGSGVAKLMQSRRAKARHRSGHGQKTSIP